MRRVRYSVAVSLDGYIAGPNGESDWIIMDPEIDFVGLINSFDTVLMGRHTYEQNRGASGRGMPGMTSIVASRTLSQDDHPKVTIVGENLKEEINNLREGEGKDIWLFGGGDLFRSMLDLQLVDRIELTIVPVLLGNGRPYLPPPGDRCSLRLLENRIYEQTGLVSLVYEPVYT